MTIVDATYNLLLSICIVMTIWSFIVLYRTHKVLNLRLRMIEQFTKEADRDVLVGRSPWWRLQALEKVSFDQMVVDFWKPIKPEAFWDDLSFLEEYKEK